MTADGLLFSLIPEPFQPAQDNAQVTHDKAYADFYKTHSEAE
ncbi:Uncharacterized protein YR821_1826 [Yersinia ruckeri]|uniref:Uncharacterized protein n=1 Tax=Yersinia ruckeri TaxID=29486 RepID=A0A0A8VD13_YERRU|nr:hypothetical protein yruck0001_13510 [Yersinia ruckeri ATCC 29473]QTD76747.1 Uncharacterized protein YR821_1826 [Yersinia ruckeri]CEK27647.1 hypothetical protein CSF007_9470 [Yersinia ruckeri]